MSESEKRNVWFYAKEYGWGWGLPACWQGWTVWVAYMTLVIGGTFAFKLDRQLPYYLAFTGVLTALLVAICWIKGEKPSWCWGGRTASSSTPNLRRLLAIHLFMGPLLLGFAVYLRVWPPAEINGTCGYRTSTSIQSQEVWDEAQRFSANGMIVAALVTIAYQAISCFTMKPQVSSSTSTGVLILTLCASIAITELHLKKRFDEHGRRIAARNVELSPRHVP